MDNAFDSYIKVHFNSMLQGYFTSSETDICFFIASKVFLKDMGNLTHMQ